MSSDLHDVFKRELDQIPLRDADTWIATGSDAARARREWPGRLLLPLVVVASVVVLSVGAGQLITSVRERLAGAPPAGTSDLPAFVAGTDLVYLAESDLGRGAVQIVQMPEGSFAGRSIGRGVVGSGITGSAGDVVDILSLHVMRSAADLAFLSVWQDGARPPGVADTYLQAVVLHSGVPTFRIPTGRVHVPSAPAPEGVEVAGPFVGEAALSADGSRVYVVRDTGENGASTELAVYDARYDAATSALLPTTGQPLATRTWTPPEGAGPAWVRIVPLDGSRVALIRQFVRGPDLTGRGSSSGLQDWVFLDEELREIASYIGPSRLSTAACAFDPIHLRTGEWAVVCSDPGAFVKETVVHFLDGRDFHLIASVPVDRALGFPLGATVTPAGHLAILTDRPAVLRYDPRSHQLIDKRMVTQASLIDLLRPSVAFAKQAGAPTVQFTTDGRFAYVAADRRLWWGGVAVVDLEGAKLVTHSTSIGERVVALRLSTDGHRLYALTADAGGKVTLALLDPATLRVLASSPPLAGDPPAIMAVASRR